MSQTQLYRHWDKDNNLLYVGISYSSLNRLRQHEKNARWFKLVSNVTIEQYTTRREAEIAEMTAIKTENPLYNIVGAVSKVVGDKPQKKMKWSRCTYIIKGKRVFSVENIPTYKAILDILELGKQTIWLI